MDDEPLQSQFMYAALKLALEGVDAGKGGPFGAVVVRGGEIVGRGCNEVTSTNDPTAHAELVAIRDACRRLGVFFLTGCELYATCEPCPMCLSALYWARIERYYFGCTAADAEAIQFADDFLRRELSVPVEQRAILAVPLLREECLAVFEAWRNKSDRVMY